MPAKKKNTSQLILALLLGVALGSGAMYASKSDETQLGNEYATVMRDGDMLVFIGATPINNNYEVIDDVKMDDLFEIADTVKAQGKGKFWKKLLTVGVQATQNISFAQRISKFVTEARSEYENADAIILGQNFKSASIIKFNQ